MKLSKLILVAVAVIGLSSFSANAVGLNPKVIFDSDGTPASEALTKKCQALADKAYELKLQAYKIRTSNEYHSDTPESEALSDEAHKLNRQAMKMCHNKWHWSN